MTDDIQSRRLEREISARKQAEALLEQKSLELFIQANERQEVLDALKESEERFRLMVQFSPDAIMIEADGQIVFANASARQMYKETVQNILLGKTLDELALYENPHNKINVSENEIELISMRLDGMPLEVAVRFVNLVYGGSQAKQVIVRDISERKKLEYQLEYQASHDALTGISNRAALLMKMQEAITFAGRHGFPVWIVFVDFDHFKSINDRFGHRGGDQVLSIISARLRSVLRKNDALGRYGGDEFILVLSGGPESELNSQFLDRIMKIAHEPIFIDHHELRVTCSLGVSSFPADGDTTQKLLDHADAAMYRAKESGRNLYQFYNAEIQAKVLERAEIEGSLNFALDRDEFFLHYQPQIDLRTGQIVGAEALLRWQHPDLGILMPDRFIKYAEATGLISRIGTWALLQACEQCMSWHRAGLGRLRIAVNLSVRQLNGLDLIELVDTALSVSGLPPDCLELELTESLMMSNVELSLNTLRALHDKGVQIAVDDFGTGYSSFTYLNRLPLDCMKIDRQFVSNLGKEGELESEIITRTLIQLAHNLHLRVIAEGVETPAQLQILRDQGCNEIQGFLYSPALSARHFEARVREHRLEEWQGHTTAPSLRQVL